MSGTGIQGQLGANPASVNFGSVGVGSSGIPDNHVDELRNSERDHFASDGIRERIQHQRANHAADVGAGLSTTLTAKFAPTSAGARRQHLDRQQRTWIAAYDRAERNRNSAATRSHAIERSFRQRSDRHEQFPNNQFD